MNTNDNTKAMTNTKAHNNTIAKTTYKTNTHDKTNTTTKSGTQTLTKADDKMDDQSSDDANAKNRPNTTHTTKPY